MEMKMKNTKSNYKSSNSGHWWSGIGWYIPIQIVILSGFILGFILALVLIYYEKLHVGIMKNADARFYFHLIGAGILGSSLKASFWLALDANKKIYSPDKNPTAVDIFGYIIFILGGSITGVCLYFLIKTSVLLLVVKTKEVVEIKPIIAGLIAFAGGFITDGIKDFISSWFKKYAKIKS